MSNGNDWEASGFEAKGFSLELMRQLGLDCWGGALSQLAKRVEQALEREDKFWLEQWQKAKRAEDHRRRLWPLKTALRAAQEMAYPEGWRLAMHEMAEVALESIHPEREAAHLLLLANIKPNDLPVEAARALVFPIRAERDFSGASDRIAFGPAGSYRSEELAQTWLAVMRRAAQGIPGAKR